MTALAGTATLVRLILRRDRLRLALWIAVLAGATVATAAALASVFPTPESRALFGAGVTGNAAVVAMIGAKGLGWVWYILGLLWFGQ